HYDDGNCTSDRLHNFTFQASIESPRFERPALRAALTGWRLVGNVRATTGAWLTIGTGTDVALNGQTGTQPPNQISDDVYADQSVNPANGFIRFLNPAAFKAPDPGTFGNMSRNSIRGPGFKNVDMALSRLFQTGASKTVEIRAEAFNVFDFVNL